MPYFRITINLKNGNNLSGIREMDQGDIDRAWQYFHSQSVKRFGEFAIVNFEVIMLSKFSEAVKAYIKQEKKLPRIEGWNGNILNANK